MINKLFLIDGLAGTGKSDLIDFVEEKQNLTSTVIYKYTTRIHRDPVEAEKSDLIFVSREDFKSRCDKDFYEYMYANEKYGFNKGDVIDALAKYENVFVIIRDRNLIERLTIDFSEMALVVPLFIYTDRSLIVERLKNDGFGQDDIDLRLHHVVYKLGIMHYQRKNVLLLTHEDLLPMPVDLIKDLRKNYSKGIDFRRLLIKWLREVSET